MNVIKRYGCNECGSHHEKPEEAESCCKHYFDVYYCGNCDDEFDNVGEAESCCLDEECFCGHPRDAHDDNEGECQAFISNLIGDCPCGKFEV